MITPCNGEEAVRLCRQLARCRAGGHPDARGGWSAEGHAANPRDEEAMCRRIAVTAYAYDQDLKKALRSRGATAILAKPLTGDTLQQTLRRLLSGE